VLAFAGIFTGPWAGLAGVACLFAGALLAWAIRRGAGGDWRASHATWLIRMFWVIVIIGLLGWYGRYWFFGGPLLLVLWLWAFWRLGKGLLHWHRNRPVERPETWF
jgi:uncharacterized membrane protein